jgi:streptogramin lyase
MRRQRTGIAIVAIALAAACAQPAMARDPVLEIPGAQVIKARRSALPDDAIFHIAVAPSGEVWVATGRGVTTVDAGGRLRPVAALARGICHELVFAPDGATWASCSFARLLALEGEAWSEVKLPAAGYTVMDIALDTRGRPWVATNIGLFARLDGGWQQVALPYGGVVKQSAVGCVAAHPDGSVFAEILNYGLVRIDAATLAYERVTAGNCPLRIDPAGNAWFARSDGLYRLPHDAIRNAVEPERLTGLRAVDIAFDAHGRSWVSTRQGGIVQYDGNGWITLAPEQRRHADIWLSPLPLAFDRNGNLWTGGAVVHYFSRAEGTGLVRVPRSSLPATK